MDSNEKLIKQVAGEVGELVLANAELTNREKVVLFFKRLGFRGMKLFERMAKYDETVRLINDC